MILRAIAATLAGLCLLTGGSAWADDKAPASLPDMEAARRISFHGDVWPILKRHCWGCHSEADAQGGLSVETVASMLKGGESGAVFEAGKPDQSLLIDMITGPKPEMPQKQPPLSSAKIRVLSQWVLAGGRDDAAAPDQVAAVRIPDSYEFAPAVTSVSLSPDGKRLAAACRSEVVLIELENAQDSAGRKRLATESDLLTHVEFSPDGSTLAAVGGSPARFGEVRFFAPDDGAVLSLRRFGHDTLFRGNFAPDGQAIAVGGADGAAHVVPLDEAEPVRSFDLHSDWVMDVAWSPDGKMLVTGGRDKSTKACSVETGQLLRTVDNSTELIGSVAVNDAFSIAAGRARTLIAYDLKIALSGIQVSGAGNTRARSTSVISMPRTSNRNRDACWTLPPAAIAS